MLFIATLMLRDKQTGKVIFAKYAVDLLRDHVVSGIDIYNTCMATNAITNTQFVMPKVLRPLFVGRLRKRKITITGTTTNEMLASIDGKKWAGYLAVNRKVVPRPIQNLPGAKDCG